MLGKDLIQDIDFGALWREQCRRSSFGPRTSADWDRRAERRSHRELDNDYSRAFLARMDLSGAKTALDIGCGTGNLAIPLAKRLRQVHALDFSPEMLRGLEKNRKQAGVDNIAVHRLSWTDSWGTVPRGGHRDLFPRDGGGRSARGAGEDDSESHAALLRDASRRRQLSGHRRARSCSTAKWIRSRIISTP